REACVKGIGSGNRFQVAREGIVEARGLLSAQSDQGFRTCVVGIDLDRDLDGERDASRARERAQLDWNRSTPRVARARRGTADLGGGEMASLALEISNALFVVGRRGRYR